MTEKTTQEILLAVGQVAERFDITVRTLHHYDEVGLLSPSRRSHAGYRLYSDDDITRLQHVVVYRRLGFALEEIALLLEHPESAEQHLRRQRAAVMSGLDEMRDLVTAIDRALEKEGSGMKMTTQERKELFGDDYADHFPDEYANEAQQRWGDTEAWKQSQERTREYTQQDWLQVKAESDAVDAAFVTAFDTGEPATSLAAMDAAELHRTSVERFYDCPHEFQRHLGDLYLTDPRFTAFYEDRRTGLTRYVRDAIHANADRHAG